ncbi:MAG TPA: YcxB family protein [Candidatus Acidoferrales bacterium]|nr:YcxB family protein [Candidatus Acidoferrales bacterium]
MTRWVLALFMCFLAFDTRHFWVPAVSASPSASAILVWLLILALVLFFVFVVPWLAARSLFRKYPLFRKSRRLSFSSEGMHLDSEDARGDYKWTIFSQIVEGPKVFYLMQTARSATYIPKRCLQPEEIAALRRLIRQNFAGKLRLRPDSSPTANASGSSRL